MTDREKARIAIRDGLVYLLGTEAGKNQTLKEASTDILSRLEQEGFEIVRKEA